MELQYIDWANFANTFYFLFAVCTLLAMVCFAWGSNPRSASERKVVIYARYSSDKQRETSLDDQIRNVRNHLYKLGIPHNDAVVLCDKEISGEREDREAYQKVRAMLTNGEIAILACDEITRLTRGSDMGHIIEDMDLQNCRFVTADGYDLDHDPHGFLAVIKAKMGNMANRELAHRVRRGIAGRVLDGNGADGTHPFGYSTRYCNPDEAQNYRGVGPKPKKEVFINESQKTVVLNIFTMYANGMSQSEIARNLNERNTPLGIQSNRRGRDGGTYQNGWHKTLIGKILKQRKYIGFWVWGEFKHRKTRNGKRIVQRADMRDVVKSERPDLAIVPLELWDKVQERLEQNCKKYGFQKGQKKRGAHIHHTEDYPSNMLSGLLFCGVCGSRMQFAPSSSGVYYRCPIAHRNGKAGGTKPCHQRGWVPYDRAVAALTEHLRLELLNCHDWVDDVYAAAIAEHQRQDSNVPDELNTVETKLAETMKAIDNMVALAENGGAPATIIERLCAREAEKRELESIRNRLARRKNREAALPDIDWLKRQLENFPDALGMDPRKSAQFFRKFFGKVLAYIVVAPGKKRGHAEIVFKASRLSAILDILGSGCIDVAALDKMDSAVMAGDEVRIALAGNDKLDRLMPTIDAMVQAGKTWREIEAELKISRCWANRYYRAWKAATTGEHNQAS